MWEFKDKMKRIIENMKHRIIIWKMSIIPNSKMLLPRQKHSLHDHSDCAHVSQQNCNISLDRPYYLSDNKAIIAEQQHSDALTEIHKEREKKIDVYHQ